MVLWYTWCWHVNFGARPQPGSTPDLHQLLPSVGPICPHTAHLQCFLCLAAIGKERNKQYYCVSAMLFVFGGQGQMLIIPQKCEELAGSDI